MAERNLPAALKTSLLAEEEYVYAHLVKFEKPRQSSEVGETSGKASDYSYITDGSVNISFNDGTVDSRGNANGTQTYVANKLMSVGTIQETTEARASNMSIVLSGTALGTIISANVSFTSTTLTADVDLFTNGFQEGDKIYLESNTGTNDKIYITVKSFSNNNQTITFTSEQGISSASSTAYTLSLASEELTALIRNKNTSTGLAYSSYMNREVFIYRVHINPETGAMIGAPFQIFRGIIAKGSISENPKKATTVTWNLTSHWGDFVRIQGRITADAYHRALTTSGTSDIGALINPAYATDYGFMHAESAVNVTGIYQAQETRYKMKKRGGLAGLMGGKKLVEYEVTVDREVDLQFNLSAKYLPIVYGVQKVDSVPVFADTLADDPATLYIAYAICEGEIGGIYDIHIDDSSTVCIDKSDFDVRSSGDADVLCNGRADKGDVLAANGSFVTTTTYNIFGTLVQIPIININYDATRAVVLGAGTNSPGGQGLLHETSFTFSTPIDATFMVHTGKSDQRANQELVNIATEQKFKIQNDYFIAEADARPYWSGSHKLLDTTYAVGKFTLSEGEVTIPKYEFVVRGKLLDCYNYDGSYVGEGNHTNFSLGDTVNIYAQGTNSLLTSDVRIIDKWSFYDAAGTIKYRFRFNKELTLESTTAFYMSDGSNTYNFFTWDHVEGTGLTLEGALSNVSVSSITVSNSTNKGSITLSSPSALVENILTELGGFIKFDLKSTINGVEQTFGTFTVESYNSSTNVITTVASHASIATLTQAKSGSGKELIFKNVLRLDSTDPNTIDAAYLGKRLKVTNYLNDIPYSKEFIISAYDGGLKVATTSTNYEEDDVVISSLSDYVVKVDADQRVSINPAIQLLDYLTSNRYGKGLDINKDIDLDSFKVAAQICDTQSDVTIISTQPATVLDKYTYTASGRLLFEGTVKSSTLRDVGGTSYYEIIFTNVIGKLGYKWNNWRSYTAGDIYWHVGKVYIAGSTGTITTTPTGSGALTSLSLTKVGGGTLAISITDGYTSSGNPIVKSFTNTTEGFNSPGYSLYDSDDVKYWKYLGWDESEQRYVTRHQMNQVINTSTPLFDNINSMLEQFNGILRYSAGKYSLDVETASPTSFASFQSISEGDILGDIKVDDKGQKDAFNSMSANIVDPANKYAGRSISFFNSEYLKEDKGIRRQGNFAMPGISNYYNARINIKQYLDESRYGITISFTIDSKGYLLLAGSIITLTHSRFGWVNKEFRISSLNFQENGLVDIVAEEHNNDAYLVENVRSSLVSGDSDSGGSSQIRPTVIGAPTDLTATLDKYNAIELSWTNAPRYNAAYTTTLIYYAEVDDFAESAVLAEVVGSSYSHVITAATSELYYYWIRHSLVKTTGATVLSGLNALEGTPGQSLGIIGSVSTILSSSDYSIVYDESGLNPTYTDQTGTVITGTGNILLTATTNLDTPLYRFTLDGIVGSWTETSTTTFSIPSQFFESSILMKVEVAVKPDGWTGDGDPADPSTADGSDEISIIPVRAGSGAIAIVLSNEAHTVPSDTNGGNPVLTGSGTSIEVFEGATVLTPITSGTATAGQYTVATSVLAGTITPNSSPSVAFGLITFGDHSAFTTDNAVIKYTITGLRLDGVTAFTLEKIQSFAKSTAGAPGTKTALVYAYQRSSSALTSDAGNVIVDLNTGKITTATLANGWSKTIPSGTNPLYVIAASANGTGTTDTIAAGEWSDPVVLSQDGTAGLNTATVFIYQRTTTNTPPASLPTGGTTYTFSTGATSFTTANGWTRTIPSSGGGYLWVSQATAAATTSTDTILQGEWASAVLLSQDGATGATGISVTGDRGARVVTGYIYYSTAQAGAPQVPSASALSINWATGVVTAPSGWSISPPTFEAGTANTYWYYTYTMTEAGTYSAVGDSYSETDKVLNPAAGSNAVKGIGFQNLVTFSSLTSQGTTQIDGGRITTGTIDAARINVSQINVTQTNNYVAPPTQTSQLNNDEGFQTQAFTSPAQINVTQTNNYVVPPSQTSQLTNDSGFQTQAFTNPGQINVTQTTNYIAPPSQISQLVNNSQYQSGLTSLGQFSNATTQFQAGLTNLGQFQNTPGFQTQAFTQPGQINVTQTTNYVSPPTQTSQLTNNSGYQINAVEFSATAISGGKIGLSTVGLVIGDNSVSVQSNNSIILDTTGGNNRIVIYDGSTPRVILGKL
jgi:hypothetical protein